jgi:hypothetical protein
MGEELELYLGRAKHKRREKRNREDYQNRFYLRHLLTEIGNFIPLEFHKVERDLYRGC